MRIASPGAGSVDFADALEPVDTHGHDPQEPPAPRRHLDRPRDRELEALAVEQPGMGIVALEKLGPELGVVAARGFPPKFGFSLSQGRYESSARFHRVMQALNQGELGDGGDYADAHAFESEQGKRKGSSLQERSPAVSAKPTARKTTA